MLSLYVHIPFCTQVCSYCSFSILANQSTDIIQSYLSKLHEEIEQHGKKYPKAEIKSLYFGGGTPNLIGAEELIKLISHIEEVFDCENIGELSFEFNPYPADQIFSLVEKLNATYRKWPRVRYSFGIQSLDNGVLSKARRPYTFPGMVEFLRALQPLKQDNNVFNFDFIAFGKFNQSKKGNTQLWTPSALDFFSDFVNSKFADSFSLYTLELFEHQSWKVAEKAELIQQGCFGTEDEIYEEFDILKEILLDAGYARYEISNFSLISKSSIHNRVYWEMEEYLGLGLHASSFIGGVRFTNTPYLPKYLAGETVNTDTVQKLSEKDYLIEKFFLSLRTDRGIQDILEFKTVLAPDWEKKTAEYTKQEFLRARDTGFVLTDRGMDCYNWIVTELLNEI
ncbi:MAG: radical SAM protein [Candidatus Peribacteria bacterium]|jgi:oxygen-independent coproporphyrinogen-3 oxidase|nr:radical SAM protein [Candidatus Peribacteria bacterium]